MTIASSRALTTQANPVATSNRRAASRSDSPFGPARRSRCRSATDSRESTSGSPVGAGRVQCPGSGGPSALPVGSESYEPGDMATVSRSRKGEQHRVPADPVITTLMTSRVVAVSPSTALIEALRVMDLAGVRHLPVVEGGRCVGLLTEVDMLRQLVTHALVQPESTAQLTAAEVCRRPAPVVPVWATRATAAHVMLALGIDAVIVLENDHIHGIVTTYDLAASLVESASAASASTADQQPPVAEDLPEIGT